MTQNWCRHVLAYTPPILYGSAVGFKSTKLGGLLQFSVVANRPLVENEIIYDLMGIMAIDGDAPHSHLSEITGHTSQPAAGQVRILDGAIRFINHSCQKFNCEVSGYYTCSLTYLHIGIFHTVGCCWGHNGICNPDDQEHIAWRGDPCQLWSWIFWHGTYVSLWDLPHIGWGGSCFRECRFTGR